MPTPSSLAQHLITALETETLPEAQADLNVDPLADPLVVFLVTLAHHDPARPFDPRSSSSPSSEQDVLDAVLRWLREGLPPATVARKMRRLQKWSWGAIALDVKSLAEELESRYALSPSTPETALGWHRIPGGILITCDILLRGHDG